MKKSGLTLNLEFKQNMLKFQQISHLVPIGILVGPSNLVFGLASKLPDDPMAFDSSAGISKRRTIYAHRVKIAAMNDVEKAFE